jgi:hypothetical protein
MHVARRFMGATSVLMMVVTVMIIVEMVNMPLRGMTAIDVMGMTMFVVSNMRTGPCNRTC